MTGLVMDDNCSVSGFYQERVHVKDDHLTYGYADHVTLPIRLYATRRRFFTLRIVGRRILGARRRFGRVTVSSCMEKVSSSAQRDKCIFSISDLLIEPSNSDDAPEK